MSIRGYPVYYNEWRVLAGLIRDSSLGRSQPYVAGESELTDDTRYTYATRIHPPATATGVCITGR